MGGVGEIAKALATHWRGLDETKLRHYAAEIGNSAAVKRFGLTRLRKTISFFGFYMLCPFLN